MKQEKEIYFQHTDPFFHNYRVGERATIACKLVGNEIHYGVAVCSKGDNFSREKGRDIAIERMQQGFAVSKYDNGYYDKFDSKHKALIAFMRTFSKSFDKNPRKYKEKVTKFASKSTN